MDTARIDQQDSYQDEARIKYMILWSALFFIELKIQKGYSHIYIKKTGSR
jgi:hypothetical protein